MTVREGHVCFRDGRVQDRSRYERHVSVAFATGVKRALHHDIVLQQTTPKI